MTAPESDRADMLTWKRARWCVLAVAGALLLLIGVHFIQNALIARAIRRINERGGLVMGEQTVRDPSWIPGRLLRFTGIPAWYVVRPSYVVSFEKEPFFGCITPDIVGDSPRNVYAGTDGLAVLRDLPLVTRLSMAGAAVSDAELESIRDLRMLEVLRLDGTGVTSRGLAHLRGLPLQYLNLSGTPLDDAGLSHLDELNALKGLDLSSTRVSGPGLAHLRRFPALRDLYLIGAPVDDEGLRHLAGLPLEALDLSHTAVSDAGIEHLKRLPSLKRVELAHTRVTRPWTPR